MSDSFSFLSAGRAIDGVQPTDRRSLAGGKELWGDLPPEVRQDLDNVMKEGFLPSREELIRRYYLSLSKKKATRGE